MVKRGDQTRGLAEDTFILGTIPSSCISLYILRHVRYQLMQSVNTPDLLKDSLDSVYESSPAHKTAFVGTQYNWHPSGISKCEVCFNVLKGIMGKLTIR